jgi:phosphoglycerate dehydrogenase-like enzyme
MNIMECTNIAVVAIDKFFLSAFDENDRRILKELGWSGNLLGEVATPEKVLQRVHGCSVAITSWDSLPFNANILSDAPELGLICHAAGSVKPIICPEVWKRKIKVTSAAAAIAKGVGEHSLGLMLSAMKNCYVLNNAMKNNLPLDNEKARILETYGITVGVVGCGLTGRHFIQLLRMFDITILVSDPFISASEIQNLGATKVELSDLMVQSDVVALHAPRLDSTRHLINKDNIKLLKDHAVIVNTASGWLIDEEALVAELKRRPIIAALDVTFPEPPSSDSDLRKLPNVILTPHIAGVAANNRRRIGHLVVEEIKRFIGNKSQLYQVTEADLAQIA